MGAAYKAEPRYPVSLPDPTKMSYAGIPYGNPLFATNTELGGYRSTDKDYFRITGALTYDVKQVKGLKLKALLHYNRYVQNFKQFRKQGDFMSIIRNLENILYFVNLKIQLL